MRLNRATIAALGAAEVKERLVQEGSEPMGSSPAQFGAYIKSEIEKVVEGRKRSKHQRRLSMGRRHHLRASTFFHFA